jgi:hypothetical protein
MKSLRALTNGLIDYAGLFPPAGLEMAEAVANYSAYLAGRDSSMLGRFIVPAARLEEFGGHALPFLPKDDLSPAWRVSALLGRQANAEIAAIESFNREHVRDSRLGRVVIDAVEFKADNSDDIESLSATFSDSYSVFAEIPASGQTEVILDAAKTAGFSAKIRTGGVEQNAFPAAENVISFLGACRARELPFKATAGLHHIVCGAYPLTYQPDAQTGTMFVFLNVFLAAAFLFHGASAADATEVLTESSAAAFRFSDGNVEWRGRELSTRQISEVRQKFAISYGSCSFTEPTGELKAMLDQQGRQ